MPVLQASGIADLVTTTLNNLGRLKFTDLATDYRNTIVLKRLMKKNKMTFDDGKAVSFNVMMDTNNSARFVGLAAQDVVNIESVMTTGSVDWRHITWNWGYEQREPVMNSGPSKIVDLIKTRRIAAFASAVVKFEQSFWRVPAATNTTDPLGVPYWIVKSNTAATVANNNGFNGTTPSGYSDVAGLSPTTFPRWANYATQYTSVDKTDFVRKLRRAHEYTGFMPIVDDIPTYDLGEDYGLYSNYAVVGALEELLEAQNENLGTDIASMDGKVVFRRTPMQAVQELDLDTTNPCYGIYWGEFGTMGLKGWWMKEFTQANVPGQHTVAATHTDCSFNWLCRNRRRQFVLATNTGVDY